MSDEVLYFPAIRVPETEWFSRVLLYWDTVATIVPFEFVDDPEFLRPYTASLMDAGLLEAVPPDQAIWSLGANRYHDAFLELVDADPLIRTGAPLEQRPSARVHTDKTGTGLALALCERGLARHAGGPEHESWFVVERRTADLLMAFLATLLGRDPQRPRDPITDSLGCLEVFGDVPAARGAAARRTAVRTELLEGVLPAPADSVPARELAAFKAERRDLLVGFRNEVERQVIAAAAIDDPDLRADHLRLSRDALAAGIDEISARMREQRWRRITAGALAGVVAGGIAMADAVAAGGALTISGASLGLVSATYAAFEGTRSKEELLSRPLAYAALAGRELA